MFTCVQAGLKPLGVTAPAAPRTIAPSGVPRVPRITSPPRDPARDGVATSRPRAWPPRAVPSDPRPGLGAPRSGAADCPTYRARPCPSFSASGHLHAENLRDLGPLIGGGARERLRDTGLPRRLILLAVLIPDERLDERDQHRRHIGPRLVEIRFVLRIQRRQHPV